MFIHCKIIASRIWHWFLLIWFWPVFLFWQKLKIVGLLLAFTCNIVLFCKRNPNIVVKQSNLVCEHSTAYIQLWCILQIKLAKTSVQMVTVCVKSYLWFVAMCLSWSCPRSDCFLWWNTSMVVTSCFKSSMHDALMSHAHGSMLLKWLWLWCFYISMESFTGYYPFNHKYASFSALTLLIGWQEGHLACEKKVVRYWHSYLSGAMCKWFAYGPADATATALSLAPVKPRIIFLPVPA